MCVRTPTGPERTDASGGRGEQDQAWLAGAGVEQRAQLADVALPDSVWEEAAAHYNEAQVAALVIAIAAINAFNRVNAVTGQVTGDWVSQYVGSRQPAEQAA
jgi:alkylhydroperoxidase family enzyme